MNTIQHNAPSLPSAAVTSRPAPSVARAAMPVAQRPGTPVRRVSAWAALALVMTAGAAVAGEPNAARADAVSDIGWHPATSSRAALHAGIDPNTFLVGHPASPTVRGGHANFEHPAVMMARAAQQSSIDPNTFIVQPPVVVTWRSAPDVDGDIRYAQAR